MIETPSFGIAFTEGKVDGAAHFFVKEDIFGAAADTRVVAKSELTKVASTIVNVEHVQEIVLPLTRTGFDDFAFAENEAHPFDSTTIVGSGNIKLDDAISTIFTGAG